MNVFFVVKELEEKYPGKKIIKNNTDNPTEILCEIEPSLAHPEYSIAISVIEKSIPHKHDKTIETYKILSGNLVLHIGDTSVSLHEGDVYEIPLHEIHWAEGNETWVECTSHPGWTYNDHILVK